jgi:hypothetical protein
MINQWLYDDILLTFSTLQLVGELAAALARCCGILARSNL